ncbi:MAG: hypothetical protein PHW03_05600 [Eubacteriales bacterium]|nr:hypothetical protein [Eubacteriales bacterium]MDD4390262.1 hypothetical protein [Eubacteriales bacterium]
MKRFGRVTAIALLMVMLAYSFCFAETLKLVGSYPEEGSENAAIENFGVKLYFNKDIYSDKSDMVANENKIVMKDENGKIVPTLVVYSPKEKNMVLVLANQNIDKGNGAQAKIEQDTEYTVNVSKNLESASGEKLKKAEKVTFKTMNQTRSTMISMILMGAMFGGIFFASSRSMRKEMKKKMQDDKVNPYKVAKETGKSVEEVVAADQKAKKKKAEKQAWREFDSEDGQQDNDNKRVKMPRPISAGGSTYITGRKALAVQKAAEARQRKEAQKSKRKSKKK